MNGLALRRIAASACVIGVLIGAAVLSYMFLDGIAQVTTLALLGTVFAVAAIWQVPKWQAEAARDLKDKSRAEFENDARKTVGDVLGGLLLILGLAATWLQVADSRQEQRDTATRAAEEREYNATRVAEEQDRVAVRDADQQALAREEQLTDRFTTAVDQLGSPSIQVHLAGIFALEGIAHDSPEDAPAVMEVLTAFVRESSPLPSPGEATPAPDLEGYYHPEKDIQAVLTVIERGEWKWADASSDNLPACLDLSRTNLRGARFRGTPLLNMCLADADLTGANLQGAYLNSADLQGANLERANLEGAQLEGADLRGADLEGVVSGCLEDQCTSLEGADLTCRSLVGDQQQCTDMRGIQLLDTDLTEASLSGVDIGCMEGWSATDPEEGCANLERSNLTKAVMRRVNLKHANLREVNLTDANLTEARLTNAFLYEVNLTDASLKGANLSAATLIGGHLTNVNLSNTNFTGGDLVFADLTHANLSGANLSEASLREVNLTGANLTGTNLSGAYLKDTNLTDADLSGANLSELSLVGTTRIDSANWEGNATPNLTAELKATPAPMATPVTQSRAMPDIAA